MKKIIAMLAAAGVLMSGSAVFASDVSIKIDGENFIAKNAQGEEVEAFIKDGSVYLPLRAMSEAMGKDVAFDAENYAVYIGSQPDAVKLVSMPLFSVGDVTVYADDAYMGFSVDDYVTIDRIMRLAEQRFTKEQIDEKVNQITLDIQNWIANGIPEENIPTYMNSPFYDIERTYYFEACRELVQSIDVGEPDEDFYNSYVTVKHILTATEEDAIKAITELDSVDTTFEELIDEYNIDPGQTADSSYTFTVGEMVPEFEEAAFNLFEEEYTKEPVKSTYGYHVIQRLPLDRDSVDTTNYTEQKLFEILPEESGIAQFGGEYYGEINNISISKARMEEFFGTWNYDDAFFTLEVADAICQAANDGNFFNQMELASLEEDDISEETDELDEEYTLFLKYYRYTTLFNAKLQNGDYTQEEANAIIEKYIANVNSEIYSNIRIFIDGELLVPTTEVGDYVAPLNIDSTVYVPVRAVSQALGMNVSWDNDTRTVIVER